MEVTTTDEAARRQGLKLLVYGHAGSGKTRLCATTPDPSRTLILSAEAGILSLRHIKIPVVVVRDRDHLRSLIGEIYRTKEYDWICIDSLSELAEKILIEEKAGSADGRRAYGEMADAVNGIIRALRDCPKNVYFTCKLGSTEDNGKLTFGPSLPGKQLTNNIAYWFDEVFCLRTKRSDDGSIQRWLQTANDGHYIAKDRSGSLEMFEPADLGAVATKILAS